MNQANQEKKKSVVCVRGLRKDFQQGKNKIAAVRGIDLDIYSGEFVAMMGASGSGKSTLLHLIAGLIQPTAGCVQVEGEDVDKMSDAALTRFRRRRIGLVFQNYNLLPHLTAGQNIMLPVAADHGNERLSSPRMAGLLDKLGIAELIGQYPETMSGGQQQRTALARALVMNPGIILADEPTGNLDSVNSQRICEILNHLCREEGRTILTVTHEPTVAIWADRIILLADGEILTEWETKRFKDARDLAAVYQETVLKAAPTAENQA